MKRTMLSAGILILTALLTGCGNDDGPKVHQGWAVGANVDGYGAIIHTKDSGATWEREGNATTIPDVMINDVRAVTATDAWAVGGSAVEGNSSSYGVILHTVDGGTTWQREGNVSTLPDTEFAGVSAVDTQTAWTVGTTGVIYKTVDGGAHWTEQAEGQFTGVFFQMVSAVDAEHAWAVGGFGTTGSGVVIIKTTDGETWQQTDTGIFQDVIGLIDVHAVSADVVWAVGTNGTVAITRNGGRTWVRTGPGGLLHVNGVCALDEKRAWIAVDSYTLYYTSDGGYTWTQQDMPDANSLPALSGAYMGVTAMDDKHVWMVGLNTPQMTEKAIIKTTSDGGQTWTPQTSPANTQLRRVSFVGDVRP